MASLPDPPSAVDLIPHLSSPVSMSNTPLPSSPSTPGSPSLHRSKTAPPPIPPPNPEVPPSPPNEGPLTSIPPPRPANHQLDDTASIAPSSPPPEHTTPVQQSSALRRTSSSLSNSSRSGSRGKKRLRFTPFTNAEAGPSVLGIGVGDVFFPEASLDQAEEGRGRGKRGVPRDQAEYLGTSDPGTPNLLET